MRIIENLNNYANRLAEKFRSQPDHEDPEVLEYIQSRFGEDILEIQGFGSTVHVKTMGEKVTVVRKEDGTFNEIVTPQDSL
jgi:hypothetical protein